MPLRSGALNRCPSVNGVMPACTFWNALSGTPAKKRPKGSKAFLAAAPAANDSVGAGSQTSMKSARMAISTLAATKSSSCGVRGGGGVGVARSVKEG
jgi:hypothetical protein